MTWYLLFRNSDKSIDMDVRQTQGEALGRALGRLGQNCDLIELGEVGKAEVIGGAEIGRLCELIASGVAIFGSAATHPRSPRPLKIRGEGPKFEELPGPVHQSLKDLHSYWLSKKGAAIVPLRCQIDATEILPLIPNMALLDVVGEAPRFRFRLFGTNLAAAYGEDLTGKFLNEIDGDGLGPEATRRIKTVVEERRPQSVRVRVTKSDDGRDIAYERIALPLSNDRETIDAVLCGFAIESARRSTARMKPYHDHPGAAPKVVPLRAKRFWRPRLPRSLWAQSGWLNRA